MFALMERYNQLGRQLPNDLDTDDAARGRIGKGHPRRNEEDHGRDRRDDARMRDRLTDRQRWIVSTAAAPLRG